MKRAAVGALILCGSIVLLAWIATRSWFIIWRLEPILERKLGGDVTIAHATYRGGGRVTIDGVTLHARGLRGPAAEIAAINRIDVAVDVRGLLSGSVRLTDAVVSGLTIRLSEDLTDSGRMNLMALNPTSGGGGGTQPPERVRIDDLTLEVGVHAADSFVLNGRRRLAGEMHPIANQEDWFAYELAEVDERGTGMGDQGFFVKGIWNYESTEAQARIEAINLDERLQMMLPQQARWWWNRMALSGNVHGVVIDWAPTSPLSVSFRVKDIAMTLPVDLGNVWSVYRNGQVEPTTSRPRMNVHEGVIRVSTDSLHLESLRGELVSVAAPDDPTLNSTFVSGETTEALVGVPYEISLSVPSIPPIDWSNPEDWMERALKTSAFELTARMDNFSLSQAEGGEAQAVGLPSIVAQTLAKFQATGWILSTQVQVHRAMPARDDGGVMHAAPLRVSGQAYINDATGSYHKFPYRMEDVDAYLRFTDERVNVEYLQARGSGNATFRMSGYIEPPDKDSLFHMEVTGVNVPLDDRFRSALKGKQLEAVEALFNESCFERMSRGGALPDVAMLSDQTRQREELTVELARMKSRDSNNADSIALVASQIAALDRSLAAGPFQLGGVVDLQLTLDRPLGPQQRTNITGVVDVRNAGLLFDRFPYPLRGSGRLVWDTDRVTIDTQSAEGGIRFVTPAGGIGAVRGEVSFPKSDNGGRKFLPNLDFVVQDDQPNESIFAAIPFGKNEAELSPELLTSWPGSALSKSGLIVKGIGLDGLFDYLGHIGTREDGKVDWDFRVRLDSGTAAPNELLAEAINARDVPWPHGMTIRDLDGDVHVRRSGVSWSDVTGVSGQTRITASGLVDFRDRNQGGGDDFASVGLVNAPVHRNALNMIASANAARAEELWNQFQPDGWVDGEIVWRSNAEPGETGVFTFQPRDVSLMLGSQRTNLRQRFGGPADSPGTVRINGNTVQFNSLAFDLTFMQVPKAGVLSLDGEWKFGGASPSFNLSGAWRSGRWESELIPECLLVFGQRQQAAQYKAFEPVGELDLAYLVKSTGPGDPLQYQFTFHPHEAAFTLRDTRVEIHVEAGDVVIAPGSIALKRVRGRGASGVFEVDGSVTTGSPMDVALDLDFVGQLRSEEVSAFLPQVVHDSLVALEFEDGLLNGSEQGASTLSNGVLRMHQLSPQTEESSSLWRTSFSGQIQTRSASFVAGMRFTEVDGTLDLDVMHEPGVPMRLEALGRASRAIVLGQDLYDVYAPIVLNEIGDAFEIFAARARSGDGAVAANAISGIGARRDYQVRIDMVGAPLGNYFHSAGTAPDSTLPATQPQAVQAPSNSGAGLPTPQRTATAARSGEMFASIVLAGDRGDPGSKRGRGVIRLINGRLSAIPLALQAMNMLQLTLPLTGSLDYADAEAFIIGDTAHFEHILFESSIGNAATLQLRGEGTLDLGTLEVAARFRPRSGLAIIRDIIGGIGDILYEIELLGPLTEPRARIVPLP